MNLVACVKRVPTTDSEPAVGADGISIDPASLKYEASFYDPVALEQAVQIKEASGGEVTALSMGPGDTEKELRECLAKGADKAVLLKDDGWAARDALSTARALSAKATELGADLILCGRIATDRDNASVGPMMAALLGWACVSDVIELSVEGGKGLAKREGDEGIESYEFSLPAVITCQKGLVEPRYAGLKGIMAAKKKPIDTTDAPAAENQAKVVSLSPPPARPEGRIVGEGPGAVPALIEALRNEAKAL